MNGRRRFGALPLFVAAAVVFTWPLVLHPFTTLGAMQGPGDPYLNLWILGWDLRAISTNLSTLFNGRIFDANIFYPARNTLAYSDHLILQALAVWPLYAITGSVVLCYNTVLFGSLVLSAWAMFAFVRRVTGSFEAALAGGLIWGFLPFHFTHLLHLQLQSLYFLPLTFLLLHRLVASLRTRDAVLLGVVAGLQTFSSIYYGLIGGMGLAIAAVSWGATAGAWRRLRYLKALTTAGFVAFVVALPGVIPYWQVQRQEGFARNLFEAGHGSAAPASYVQAPPTNVVWGRTGILRPLPGGGGPLNRREGPEQDLFPGFVVLACAAIGAVRARRLGAGGTALTLGIVGCAGFVLSLGPDGFRALYSTLYDSVFGFQAIRAPARFSVLAFFALAGLAGIGVQSLVDRFDKIRARSATAIVLALISGEFLNGSIPYVAAPAPSEASAWLARAQEPGPVIYLPLGGDIESTTPMVASLVHGRPIVNGYSGQRPAFYEAFVETMSRFPSVDALLVLRDLGIRFVVSNGAVESPQPSPLVERARLADGVVYELVWSPEVEAVITAAADSADNIVPPPPGPLPFAGVETARYRVRWLDGPLAIPAGEATITAERGDSDGLRFTVLAKTAAWVERFYQASDRFETRTDPKLLPIDHRQDIQQGRQEMTRLVTFDRTSRRVSVVTNGGPPVAFPLATWARDPIAALFYVRTLPLAAGYHERIPISDAGRPTILDLQVVGTETVTLDGKTMDAWKVEPRLVARVERRAPIKSTVWLTRDERRLPLVINVSAGFGSVVVELVGYDYDSK